MKVRTALAALVLAIVVLPAPRGHAQSLAGTWNVELGEWATDGGGQIQMRMGNQADLTITLTGDSALVIFQPRTDDGSVRADTLRGRLADGKIKVTGSRKMRTRTLQNGEEMGGNESSTTIEIELAPAGDALTGTMRFNLPGGLMSAYAPVTARRRGDLD